jgi:cytochrome c oxidase subunit II
VTSRARLALLALLLWTAACAAPAAGQAPSTPTPTLAEHGQMLFRNKGCVTCHAHNRAGGETGLLEVGPNLSAYRNDPAFLRAWLADPQAVRPETTMPNLKLSAEEIEALIAFLNAGS